MTDIRVNRGIVVNVNDNGDTITIPVEDPNFSKNFYGLMEMLEGISDEAKQFGEGSVDTKEYLQFMSEKMEKVKAGIDNVFGQDCCKKVFGDILPGPYLVADFFDQLVPIVREYSDKRKNDLLAKYNRNRKGGSHV